MASQGWGTDRPVAEDLFAGVQQFDFVQAMRLLEMLTPHAARPGNGAHPGQEPVRLRASADMAFVPTDVLALSSKGEKSPPELTVGFLGLAGAQGPLPLPIAQWVRDRERRRDTGLRDFLDIFHHRLLTLRYRARLARRVGLEPKPPERHMVASWLFSLMGLGTEGLRDRHSASLPERALLRYAGLLARRPRSMAALEAVLQDFFGVPVRGQSFVGAWLALDKEQQTRLGRTGRNQYLGQAVLGRRVWDWQARFKLTLGPVRREQLHDFLPGGAGLEALQELVRFVVGTQMDFQLELVVEAAEVPEARLGQSRLGWTSWMANLQRSRQGKPVRLASRKEDGRVVLMSRSMQAPDRRKAS